MYKTIALDLEGTLISNAHSQLPRPGLKEFLEFCVKEFNRVVLFTCVDKQRVCDIWSSLDREGYIPEEIKQIEVIEWNGQYKNLQFISENSVFDTLLVDDQVSYIDPNQKNNWISISCWDYPYHSEDQKLFEVVVRIQEKLIDLSDEL